LSCVESTTLVVKVTPAHAVPPSPTPVALNRRTPGSTAGQSAAAMLCPQLGTSVIDDTVTFRLASGPFERLVSVNDAGAPVWPTINELGKFGATPKATPADAGETTPKRTAPHTSATTSTERTVDSGPGCEDPRCRQCGIPVIPAPSTSLEPTFQEPISFRPTRLEYFGWAHITPIRDGRGRIRRVAQRLS
jgi:hypothetical protein